MSTDNKIIRTEEEQKISVDIYNTFRDDLLKRQLSNTENYDKSILTLSSAGLAMSLTVLKFIVPVEQANSLWLIKASWLSFLLSIILSLVAYLISNAAITKALQIAEDYYVNKEASAFNKSNWLSTLNNWLNYAVGILFSIAITAVVAFVIVNLNQEENLMSNKDIEVTDQMNIAMESATIPTMQKVPAEGELSINSAQVPTMQAAPGTSSSQTQQTTQADSSTDSNK